MGRLLKRLARMSSLPSSFPWSYPSANMALADTPEKKAMEKLAPVISERCPKRMRGKESLAMPWVQFKDSMKLATNRPRETNRIILVNGHPSPCQTIASVSINSMHGSLSYSFEKNTLMPPIFFYRKIKPIETPQLTDIRKNRHISLEIFNTMGLGDCNYLFKQMIRETTNLWRKL